MNISRRSDDRIELDWNPPDGPFVTVTKAQWDELLHQVRLLDGQRRG